MRRRLWVAVVGASLVEQVTTGNVMALAADQLGQITEYAIPTAASFPTEIIAGPDGNLWFTEDPGNKIGKVATTGAVPEFALPDANSHPLATARGADGN